MNKQQFTRMLMEKAAKTKEAERFAERAKQAILMELEPHRDTGAHAASVTVERRRNSQGLMVPYVAVNHPAAYWSNYGHWVSTENGIKWVDGIHYMEKAARRLRRRA